MGKSRILCLAVTVGLVFLVACRSAANSRSHLVAVQADSIPGSSSPQSSGTASSGASASSGDRPTVPGLSDTGGTLSQAVLPDKKSPGTRAESRSSAKNSAPVSSACSSGPSHPTAAGSDGPTEAEAVAAVNAAFAKNDALPRIRFSYVDSLTGAVSQSGTVQYNNCPSAPEFVQIVRMVGTGGHIAEVEYQYKESVFTSSAAGGQPIQGTYDPGQLIRYVQILTPRLNAGALSQVKAQRLNGGGLALQAVDAPDAYGDAVVIAGLSGQGGRVTRAAVCYTVGADGRLDSSSQQFTIRVGDADRVLSMDKTYVR